MKNIYCCLFSILFVFLFAFFYGALFGFAHLNKTEDIAHARLPRSIFWNYEMLRNIKSYIDLIKKIEESEEKLIEKEQSRRDKIYREKLVCRIKSTVLHDFWTSRY